MTPVSRLAARVALLLSWLALPLQAAELLSHQLHDDRLLLRTSAGAVMLRFHTEAAVEVAYEPPGLRQLPSFSIAGEPAPVAVELQENEAGLVYRSAGLAVHIRRSPLQLRYLQHGRLLLAEEAGLVATDQRRGFRFALQPGEKLAGGGQRVLGGMDRRGQRLPLYNKAHYGYETHSKQMYFSIPAVLSDRGYLLLFDNSARGWMDLGKTEPEVLSFFANGGRTAYLVVAGGAYPDILRHYTAVTGRQPLPPRWALGSFASRFGYRNARQVRETVARYRATGFPLDAVVLDLYWFGPDIKGHMGRLDWDRQAFPDPPGLLAELKRDNIHTVLVTEPFILTTSTRWQEAVAAGALATDHAGRPKTFDFYFGNTGLVDVFKPAAMDWFHSFYRRLGAQGVDGWWGDLGEPEVHPRDTLHALPGAGPLPVSADSVHNAYGHQWAAGLYPRLLADQPGRRPFIMMRAGAAGSQRYGMIPWTGDVARSWGGLQPQVELALQMSLLGLAWTHSDLGGFAGGKRFDRELYVRWLQYGVFQPVFRPHAQDHIAAEPALQDRRTRELLRESLQLRLRMLPYNYTLAWENSQTGMPLMRPLLFEDARDPSLFDRTDAYLWGDAFLVRPITAPKLRAIDFAMPKGAWFDFWDGRRYEGGRTHRIKIGPARIPVFVRAGSVVPMVAAQRNTELAAAAELEWHYWPDPGVPLGSGRVYADDGHSPPTAATPGAQQLQIEATPIDGGLRLLLRRDPPAARPESLVLHGPTWAGDRRARLDWPVGAAEMRCMAGRDELRCGRQE